MKYETITTPATRVVSLDELKQHLAIIDDANNSLLTALSTSAETYVENETRRFMVTRTIDAYFDSFDCIVIAHRPAVAITSVKYYDDDGELQTMTTDDYAVDAKGLDTVVTFGVSYPSLSTEVPNPIIVRYTVGYGAAAAVPELLKYAVKGLVAHWYLNREPILTGIISTELPLHVESIVNQYRIVEV